MTLSGLANVGGSRRLSHDERLRRDWEAFESAKREEKEREEARIQKIVDECTVEVVEVSAKDGFGTFLRFSCLPPFFLREERRLMKAFHDAQVSRRSSQPSPPNLSPAKARSKPLEYFGRATRSF
jgi:hypothetical protein